MRISDWSSDVCSSDLGFKLLLRNPAVNAILVNIYGGGILRCDTVAEGVAAACREEGLRVPLIVRAAGTTGELARKILMSPGIPVTFAPTLAQAAATVVRAAGRQAALCRPEDGGGGERE